MGCGCAGLTAPVMIGGGQIVSVARATEGRERARGRHQRAQADLEKARQKLKDAANVHAKAAKEYKMACSEVAAWQQKVKRAKAIKQSKTASRR